MHLIREAACPPNWNASSGSGCRWGRVGSMRDPRLESLNLRRRGINLRLLAEGLDGSAIAEKLFVSPATVRNHVQHILTKLEVHSRLEAVTLACAEADSAGTGRSSSPEGEVARSAGGATSGQLALRVPLQETPRQRHEVPAVSTFRTSRRRRCRRRRHSRMQSAPAII